MAQFMENLQYKCEDQRSVSPHPCNSWAQWGVYDLEPWSSGSRESGSLEIFSKKPCLINKVENNWERHLRSTSSIGVCANSPYPHTHTHTHARTITCNQFTCITSQR